MKHVIADIDKVLEILSSEDKWTQGAAARDETGLAVTAGNSTAVCHCVHGALTMVDAHVDTYELLRTRSPHPRKSIVLFNDDPRTRYQMVIDFLVDAKDAAKSM